MPHKRKRQRRSQVDRPTVQAQEPSGVSTEDPASNLHGKSEENSSVKKRPMINLDISAYIQEHEALKIALPTLKSDYAVVNARTRFLDGVTSVTKHKVKQMDRKTKTIEIELAALESAYKELKEKNQALEKKLNHTVVELLSTRETVKGMEEKMATMDARVTAIEGNTTSKD